MTAIFSSSMKRYLSQSYGEKINLIHSLIKHRKTSKNKRKYLTVKLILTVNDDVNSSVYCG